MREEFERRRAESRQLQQQGIVGRNVVEQSLFACRVLGKSSLSTHLLRADLLLALLLKIAGGTEERGLLDAAILYDSGRECRPSLARQAFVARPNVAVLSVSQDHTIYGFCIRHPFPADRKSECCDAFSFVASVEPLAGTPVPFLFYSGHYGATVTLRDDSFVYHTEGRLESDFESESESNTQIHLEIPSRAGRKARHDVLTYKYNRDAGKSSLDTIDTTWATSVRVLVAQVHVSTASMKRTETFSSPRMTLTIPSTENPKEYIVFLTPYAFPNSAELSAMLEEKQKLHKSLTFLSPSCEVNIRFSKDTRVLLFAVKETSVGVESTEPDKTYPIAAFSSPAFASGPVREGAGFIEGLCASREPEREDYFGIDFISERLDSLVSATQSLRVDTSAIDLTPLGGLLSVSSGPPVVAPNNGDDLSFSYSHFFKITTDQDVTIDATFTIRAEYLDSTECIN